MEFCGFDFVCWVDFFFNYNFWQQFISNTLATFLGVIIGIPVALWLSRYQERRTEKERKNKILTLLKDELIHNRNRLREWSTEDADYAQVITLSALLRDELWRAFSDGGELQWIKDLDLYDALADAYHMVRVIRYSSDKHYDTVIHGRSGVSKSGRKETRFVLNDAIEYGETAIVYAVSKIDEQI